MTMHQPQPPALTVDALTSWLRDQDPDKPYIYQDPVLCLLGYYFIANSADVAISEAAYEQMPHYREIAKPEPHTFGAALARAEQLPALPPPALEPTDISLPVREPLPVSQTDPY